MPKHNRVVSVAEFNEVVLVPHPYQTASPVRRLLVRCKNNVVLGTVIYRLRHLDTGNQPIQSFTCEDVLFVPVFLLFLGSLVVIIPLNISANSAILLGFLELFFFFCFYSRPVLNFCPYQSLFWPIYQCTSVCFHFLWTMSELVYETLYLMLENTRNKLISIRGGWNILRALVGFSF